MSRGKRNRKAIQKKKRIEREKAGKLVPFDLQNSPKKYPGFKNKYCYKTNIHNLIYKDGYFENVKFQASNITDCNYKNAKMVGIDFVGCNLKGTNFTGAYLENVVFFNCKLDKTKFTNCHFKNVYFIMTDVGNCVDIPENSIYLKTYPKIELNSDLQEALSRFCNIEESIKYHVLLVNKRKPNLWMISILINRFGQDACKALLVFSKKKGLRRLYTLHAYIKFIEKYLQI